MKQKIVLHIVYQFSMGGLENVVAQLVNRLPADRFTHVILSLTTATDFTRRLHGSNVRVIELNKPPGHAWQLYPRIYRLLRQIRPDIVHSCNLAALEIAPLSWLARVRRRVHAEHGWDSHDPDGTSLRYQKVRRLYKPFVGHYVTVSQDLDGYLQHRIGVPAQRRTLIANGVDTDCFSPLHGPVVYPDGCPFGPGHWLIGTVGRLQTVKNQPLLARAFVRLLRDHPGAADRARLVVVGDGPLREEVESILAEAGLRELAWMPGARNDVPAILRVLDCFVLPSQTEGTSCTLQEAMASGLPTVATAVGGTPYLVDHERTGFLVEPGDADAMAEAIWRYMDDTSLAKAHGAAARAKAVDQYGMDAMVQRYQALFEAV